MTPQTRLPLVLAALATAAGAPAPVRAQASNWQSVASACVAATVGASQQVTVAANGSFIRAKPAAGPNPPTLNYVCNVLDASDSTLTTWTKLRLEYLDVLGGQVTATLYAKSKSTGALTNLGQVVGTPSNTVTTATVGVPPLNFATHSHYVLLGLQPQPGTQPQLHAVTLAE